MEFSKIETLLPYVTKPGRYIGGEKNQCVKNLQDIKARICFIFPDVYEIGMSNSGINILYSTINKHENFYAERAFTPWKDFGEKLKENKLPLYSLETKTPLKDFDILGISIPYERLFTNVLYTLDLAQVPLLSSERAENDPLIIAGGPSCVNPAPMSNFIDLFHIGEAEECSVNILEIYSKLKDSYTRSEIIEKLSNINGIYNPHKNTLNKTSKNIYYSFTENQTNHSYLIPNIVLHQDKGNIQVARGCIQGCRFCQAGMIDRPLREKPIDLIIKEAHGLINNTGVKELSLNALSISDYSNLGKLVNELLKLQDRGINLGLPSLRVNSYNLTMAKAISSLRKTGLTFAIEVGSAEARSSINKSIDKTKLLEIVNSIFDAGWKKIKFYFMIGLPGIENEAQSIVNFIQDVINIGKKHNLKKFITLSVNAFVPKPWTPYQWCGMNHLEELQEKLEYLKKNLHRRYVQLKWNNLKLSFLEGALCRVGKEIGEVILSAYQNGACFDGWDEEFNSNAWNSAFQTHKLSLEDLATKKYPLDSNLPWDNINIFVKKDFLKREFEKSLSKVPTDPCKSQKCNNCGDFPHTCPNLEYKKEETEIKINKKSINTFEGKTYKTYIYYSKNNLLRFISHLDLISILEKAIRMSELPVSYTLGYNSNIKISFSEPVPIGVTSECEWFSIELTQWLAPKEIHKRLGDKLPSNIKIKDVNFGSHPTKIFKSVEYIIEGELPKSNNKDLKFPYTIDTKSTITKLKVPYPQPLGIYNILKQIYNLEKTDSYKYKIIKNSLLKGELK